MTIDDLIKVLQSLKDKREEQLVFIKIGTTLIDSIRIHEELPLVKAQSGIYEQKRFIMIEPV